MKDFLPLSAANARRQDFPVYYRLNGAIYVVYWDYFKKQGTFWGESTYAYIMPQERSTDIDTYSDFVFAEFLMQKIGKT